MAEPQFSDNRGRIWPDSEPRNPQNGQSVSSHNPPTVTHTRYQLVPWPVGDLRPHPSYARLGIKVPASRLNALLEMGEDAFLFPLIVTSKGIVIDGYARLEVARLQRRTKTGDPEILRALCNGEIKIDRAWRWSKESRICQCENLKLYRRHRGMERVAEKLVARQVKKLKYKRRPASRWKSATLSETIGRLGSLAPEVIGAVDVIFIKAPASILALSEDIAQRLGFREESSPCN